MTNLPPYAVRLGRAGLLFALTLAAAGGAGCGYKGPLYLPKPKATAVKAPVVVVPEAAPGAVVPDAPPARPVPSEAAPLPK